MPPRARSLLAEVNRLDPVFQGSHLGRISASIGVAVYPDHVQDAESLFQAADAAVYTAKAGGCNRATVAGEKPRPRKRSSG